MTQKQQILLTLGKDLLFILVALFLIVKGRFLGAVTSSGTVGTSRSGSGSWGRRKNPGATWNDLPSPGARMTPRSWTTARSR